MIPGMMKASITVDTVKSGSIRVIGSGIYTTRALTPPATAASGDRDGRLQTNVLITGPMLGMKLRTKAISAKISQKSTPAQCTRGGEHSGGHHKWR